MPLDPLECFRLANVRLSEAEFQTTDGIENMVIDPATFAVQTRRWVSHYFFSPPAQGEPIERLFARVNLGIRVVDGLEELRAEEPVGEGDDAPENEEEDEPDILYGIEATLTVEFVVQKRSFSTEDLQTFLDKNAVHIAWPFWREHVFSTLRAASLPLIEIPLLAGMAQARAQVTR